MNRMFRSIGTNDLFWSVFQAVIPFVGVYYRLAELQNTGDRGVMGVSRLHRLPGRFTDMVRSDEIGLSQREFVNLDPRALQLLGLCGGGDGGGGFNSFHCF